MDITKLKAVGPWVLVKVHPRQEKTEGGIYLPQGNYEERVGHAKGTVISTGKGKRTEKGVRLSTGVEVGEVILFRGFLSEANQPDVDMEHSLIHMDDIIGVVE